MPTLLFPAVIVRVQFYKSPMESVAGVSSVATSSNSEANVARLPVVCHVHGVGKQYESGTEANPFRRFVRYTVPRCTFFRWVDDELTPHYLGAVQRMMQRQEALETQLKYKSLLTEVLDEKLKLKDEQLRRRRSAEDGNCCQGNPGTGRRFMWLMLTAGIVLIIAIIVRREF